jgi:hypothetical protein
MEYSIICVIVSGGCNATEAMAAVSDDLKTLWVKRRSLLLDQCLGIFMNKSLNSDVRFQEYLKIAIKFKILNVQDLIDVAVKLHPDSCMTAMTDLANIGIATIDDVVKARLANEQIVLKQWRREEEDTDQYRSLA